MSALIRALLVIALAASPALAERVLLADSDPELERAIRTALAPWKLEVVVDAMAPIDAPQTLADAHYIVWRANGELVVYDRARNAEEHRAAPAGPLDPASAAAAALTVKTLLRLPALEDEDDGDAGLAPAVTAPVVVEHDDGTELRVQAGVAARATSPGLGVRASLSTFLKPAQIPLRFGVAGELGNAVEVQKSGFRGTWSDWSVLVLASWTIAFDAWEIEPHVGAGILQSRLDGDEGMIERHERETLAVLRGGAFVRVHTGRFSIGGVLALDTNVGTPAYTRMQTGAQFFEVPQTALSVGVILATDIGR